MVTGDATPNLTDTRASMGVGLDGLHHGVPDGRLEGVYVGGRRPLLLVHGLHGGSSTLSRRGGHGSLPIRCRQAFWGTSGHCQRS